MPRTESARVRADPGYPRWSALLLLAAGVLVAHILLLAGAMPGWRLNNSDRPPSDLPVAAMQVRSIEPAAGPAEPRDAPMATGSTARWVEPTPKKPPSSTPPPPQKAPSRPARQPDAPAPESTPEPAPLAAPSPAPVAPEPEAAAAPNEPSSAVLPDPAPTAAPEQAMPADLGAKAPTGRATRDLPPALPANNVKLLFDALVRAKGMSVSADAQLDWQQNGDEYSIQMEISAFLLGSRIQTSSGRLGSSGLKPLRFGDKRRGSEKATHFDHDGQRIRYSSNAPDSVLQPGTQDRISVFLQLGALLQARPEAYVEGQSLRLPVASTGDAETWQFQIGPEEELTLPAGNVRARKLTRAPRREFDSTVEIWLAPSLQYLPVRIRITEHNGDQADQQLRQMPVLTPLPPTVQ